MARKPSPRSRGNTKSTIIKKSLSLSPAAWRAIKLQAKLSALSTGMPANHSVAASTLVVIGYRHSVNNNYK